MDYSKNTFIQLALKHGVLKFGQFKLKSGRISPYFFNAGLFCHASTLQHVGHFYANILINKSIKFDHLFGPAYKGIPLVTATAIALASKGIETTVTFNRKEIKDHGEGGQLMGSPLWGKTVLIDDVITAGTAFREAQSQINEQKGQLTTVLIALDRCERGLDKKSTADEIREQGIEVLPIINLFDLISFLKQEGQTAEVQKIEAYYQEYGLY